MHFEQAKIDILLWVTGFVEKPHPLLNGWSPCPYSRKARLDGKFDIRQGQDNPYNDLQTVRMDELDVIAYVYDPKEITASEFNSQVQAVNQEFLVPLNMLALADHPDDVEEINGVRMNQGTWAIAFLQPLKKLNEHARMIANKGYYNGWPEDYLKNLFEFRQDPRT